MAFPWLAALKVIPWGQVIEHSPKVLARARDLMKNRQGAPFAPASAADSGTQAQHDDFPSLVRGLEQARAGLLAQRHRLEEQEQIVAALLEHNETLARSVQRLSRQLNRLWAALAVVVLAAIAVHWFG